MEEDEPEDKDVRGRSGGDTQFEVNHSAGVGDNEFPHRVGAESGALGRGEYRRQTLVCRGGVDLHEEQVAGKAAGLPEPGPAFDVHSRSRPRGALLVGEGAPQISDATEASASEDLGLTGGFARHSVAATDLAIAGYDADTGAELTGLRDVEYSHFDCRGGGVPGPARVNAQAVGVSRGTRASPMPYCGMNGVKESMEASELCKQPPAS